MKKIKMLTVLTSILVLSSNTYAEDVLTNQSIQGTWKLDYTKTSQKSKEQIEREDTWVFNNNGTVVIKHIPREGGYYDQLAVNYDIKDEKLKIAILGRSGKFDSFSLVSMDEKNMTLKARFGDIYQFVKK